MKPHRPEDAKLIVQGMTALQEYDLFLADKHPILNHTTCAFCAREFESGQPCKCDPDDYEVES